MPTETAQLMPCTHGTTPLPDPLPFKDDELRVWLGLPDTQQGRDIAANTSPADRAVYEQMRATEMELKRGRIPKGVIACDRNRR